jgi:hypothetical protein
MNKSINLTGHGGASLAVVLQVITNVLIDS